MRATSTRRTQRNKGRVVSGVTRVKAPDAPSSGRVRCPVCRNGASLTPNGYLRKHCDLFGLTCYNRRPSEETAHE